MGLILGTTKEALAAIYAHNNPVAVTMTAQVGVGLFNAVDDLLRAAKIIEDKR